MYKLFITGFLQVFFVALNTYLIANAFFVGVFFCGFTISFIWTFNVSKVAFGGIWDKVTYSIGAAVGGITGLFIAQVWV